MTNYAAMKRRIMFRVYCTFVCRKACEPRAIKVMLFVVLTGATVSLISIKHVLLNIAHLEGYAVHSFVQYFTHAIMYTELSTKLTLLSGAAFMTWLGVDTYNSFKYRKDSPVQVGERIHA